LWKYSGKYTGLSKFWAGPVCTIIVNDAKLAKKVLTHEKCMTKTQVIIQNIPFGEGLFTVNESKLIFIINLGNHWCLFF
jgi:hypothetical protein